MGRKSFWNLGLQPMGVKNWGCKSNATPKHAPKRFKLILEP